MGDIAPQQAVEGRCGEELHVVAAIITPGKARFARVADDVGFNSHAVAGFEVFDCRVDGEDLA